MDLFTAINPALSRVRLRCRDARRTDRSRRWLAYDADPRSAVRGARDDRCRDRLPFVRPQPRLKREQEHDPIAKRVASVVEFGEDGSTCLSDRVSSPASRAPSDLRKSNRVLAVRLPYIISQSDVQPKASLRGADLLN
jgi:hypothetical protein